MVFPFVRRQFVLSVQLCEVSRFGKESAEIVEVVQRGEAWSEASLSIVECGVHYCKFFFQPVKNDYFK